MVTSGTSPVLPTTQILAEWKVRLQKFFNGQTIEEVQSEIELLRETLITESYGELDKEDKWFLIEFIKRVADLVETTNAILLR